METEGNMSCDGFLISASAWRSYGHRVADVISAGDFCRCNGMAIIACRSAAEEKRFALTVKLFALHATQRRDLVMSNVYMWQTKALTVGRTLIDQNAKDMSVEAGVGSGKTYFSTLLADLLLSLGIVHQVIIVTTNRRCQRQWRATMRKLGIKLLLLSGNSGLKQGLPADVKGYITTYAGMGFFPDLHAAYCGRAKTLVILDEVHHINDDPKTKWGTAAKTAFESARFRLCLSGTFFSSNGAPIPFARMKPRDGSNDVFEYDPHVIYPYGESVADGICRRVVFKPFDGLISFRREGEVDFRTATFAENIDPEDRSLRLWASCESLGVDGQPNKLLEKLLFSANRQLFDLRTTGHSNAAGLIVCRDQTHARKIKTLLHRLTGEKAMLVISDEEGSSDNIDAFAQGTTPWMISVRMVTEGVDIPRLRVGVYLSNVVELLTFFQFIGREVRLFKGDREKSIPPHPLGESYIFLPADPRLCAYAEKIEDEVRKAIERREKREPGSGPSPGSRGVYESGGSDRAAEQDNTIAGKAYTAEEIDIVSQLRLKHPPLAELPILEIVSFVRDARQRMDDPGISMAQEPEDDEDHDSLRKKCQKKVGRLAALSGQNHNDIHLAANQVAGIRNANTATTEQLKAKKAWLEEQIILVRNGSPFSEDDDDD